MKDWFIGFAMCHSCFCAIPFPCHAWKEECRNKMLLCLPLLGLEIGALWYGIAWLCFRLGLPVPVSGAVIGMTVPVLTGCIHLDGFMDVMDAVRSYRSLERRREILKDSHVGSFAVIGVVMLFVMQTALGTALIGKNLLPMMLIPVVSRSASAAAVAGLPPMHTSQYAAMEKKKSTVAAMLAVVILACAASLLLWGKSGLCVPAACAGYALALRRAYKSLEGMNGDISGFSQTVAELTGLAVLALI